VIKNCQSCGSPDLESFYEVRSIPVQTTVLLDSEDAARAFPTGDLELALCHICGFIQNVRFAPGLVDYSLPTEESQAFSPVFTQYAAGLAQSLVDEYGLVGRCVLEIGSGKGEFLALLAEAGIGCGLGIDPGFLPDRAPQVADKLEFRREFYGPDHVHLTGDLVVARHLLEHVPNVREFFGWLLQSMEATVGSSLFVEVPDTERILREAAFWDIYYEHCSYFTVSSMTAALLRAGLTPVRVGLGFDDQYILAKAIPGTKDALPQQTESLRKLGPLVKAFGRDAGSAIELWRTRLAGAQHRGEEVVLWGASSKTVSFLSAVGLGDVTVVDINPHKQGQWLPGVAVEVLSPRVLADMAPGLVIPMNPIYTSEIRADLLSMGLEPDLEPIG